MIFAENLDCCQYDVVAKIFIEFRSKGVSLSTFDLDILNQWEKNSLDPIFICQVMYDIYAECQKNGKNFPSTLTYVARRIDKILLKMQEV